MLVMTGASSHDLVSKSQEAAVVFVYFKGVQIRLHGTLGD